jgi:GST-like protein
MSTTTEYTPPKVWTWDKPSGGRFENINRPISGSTHEKELPVGRHPLQLYSLGTPNGVKVTVMLEELLALGHRGAEYDAWLIKIGEGDQFGSGFVAINPNSKIPALLDRSGPKPIRVFETGAILVHLAEKSKRSRRLRRGSRRMPVGRSGRWAARRTSAAGSTLLRICASEDEYAIVVGDETSGAGCAGQAVGGQWRCAGMYRSPIWRRPCMEGAVRAWAAEFCRCTIRTLCGGPTRSRRPAVRRGRMVTASAAAYRASYERHDASDFDTKTCVVRRWGADRILLRGRCRGQYCKDHHGGRVDPTQEPEWPDPVAPLSSSHFRAGKLRQQDLRGWVT